MVSGLLLYLSTDLTRFQFRGTEYRDAPGVRSNISMTRSLRIQAAQAVFHVVNRGNNRQIIFSSADELDEYHSILKKYKEKFSMHIYHYVFMPNHIHLMLEPTQDDTLAKFMQAITLSHTRRTNNRSQRSGHLWQGRYFSQHIDQDSYILQCGRYIELNPVRAGLVIHPVFYRWSSYCAYAEGVTDTIVDVDPLFALLGEKIDDARRVYKDLVGQQVRLYQATSKVDLTPKTKMGISLLGMQT